jgi:hypothetical protein
MPGISEKELLALQAEGWDSEMIRYRLGYAAAESVLKYLRPLIGLDRVHCHYLPTQKSGRWSTTNPPLANFSPGCISPACLREEWHVARSTAACWSLRDLVVPDPGSWFLKFDFNAIEAKLAAAFSDDEEDLALFAMDADIHTITMCRMFGFPEPPDIMDPHRAESCRQWRADLRWDGKDDWRRVGSKTCRFSLAYAIGASGIHEAKDAQELARLAGVDRKGLEAIAQKYLDSKPGLVAWKYRTFTQIMKTSEVRTFLGRRKRLFVSEEECQRWLAYRRPGDACKQGLNHLCQASVADIMNLTITAIKRCWPSSRFGYQSHDGLLTCWPNSVDPFPAIKEVVEKVWKINGHDVKLTATWGAIYDDGTKKELD